MPEEQSRDTQRDEVERCKPHGNRLPCPRCLAEKYGVQVWNSI